jgi:hypothetical protein
MNLPDAPIAQEGFFATHFFAVKDQEKSKDFYVRILGGKLIKAENPCYIKLANSWIILNCGGGPTPDRPEVVLETPTDLNRASSFLNLRVPTSELATNNGATKARSFLRSRCRIPTAGNGAATGVIPTGTPSRLANIRKWRSTVSKLKSVELAPC